MSDAKFDGADMTEVVMSKAYAVGASFKGNKNRTTHLIVSLPHCILIIALPPNTVPLH
jgi:uncharacterized protein YjbI with pentapeptide repeats